MHGYNTERDGIWVPVEFHHGYYAFPIYVLIRQNRQKALGAHDWIIVRVDAKLQLVSIRKQWHPYPPEIELTTFSKDRRCPLPKFTRREILQLLSCGFEVSSFKRGNLWWHRKTSAVFTTPQLATNNPRYCYEPGRENNDFRRTGRVLVALSHTARILRPSTYSS